MRIELGLVIADGEVVCAEWSAKATTHDGGEYDNHAVAVFMVRGGRIVTVREYLDTQHVGRVLFQST